MKMMELDALKKIVDDLRARLWGGSPDGRMALPPGWLLPATSFLRPARVRAQRAPLGALGRTGCK